jgi:cell cycle sensor histidine kinase DivJ
VAISAAREGGNIAVVVEDTGVGIGEDDLPRLGEAFFQARASYDRRHDGTGLGLSIVKGLVQLHDGSMEIGSKLGKGTRVTIRLPVAPESRVAEPIEFTRGAMREPEKIVSQAKVKKSA